MNPELPAHHVTPSMKAIMLVFAVVLIATLGWFVWDNNMTADTTDNSAPKVTKTTTTTDETADWKTFTGTGSVYTFEYPADASLKDPNNGTADGTFVSGDVTYSVGTETNKNSKTTIEDWIKDKDSAVTTDLSMYTKTTLDGQTAYTVTGELRTYVLKDKKVYLIVGREGVAPSTKTTDTTYAHLLASFKFTK